MQAASSKQQAASSKQQAAKNGELLELVKHKVRLNIGRHPCPETCHPARGTRWSGAVNSVSGFVTRPRNKRGVTSPSRIFNLIGLLKYVQTRKINSKSRIMRAGFTLVELAIVLVIIGLLVGGGLVGNDLIKAAEVRSQIQQIEKYNAAANTFKVKYNYLPGDIPDPTASAFGFVARGTLAGQGNGNGIITGFAGNPNYTYGFMQCGEPQMFWVDLSFSGLIEGSYSRASPTVCPFMDVTGSGIDDYLPIAKLGNNLHVYTWNLNYNNNGAFNYPANPKYRNSNFFTISNVQTIAFSSYNAENVGTVGIAVKQAHSIDLKIDDGLPISGNVTTISTLSGAGMFSNNDVDALLGNTSVPGGSAIPASSTTCYDNSNNAANNVNYSLSQNGGNGLNCALSFKFQ
jgi:prepilin-type N-terminal cleavage/methylation domain-containing protein